MVHAELAREIAKARTAELVDARRADRPSIPTGAGGPRAALTPFEQALSAAGSILLLAIVLVGPLALVVPVLAAVVAAGIGLLPGPGRRRRAGIEGDRKPHRSDRWLVWRAVEPDPGYVGRRAA
jgi:hypothetical protein